MGIESIKALTEKHREKILHAYEEIWAHPETGYKEWRTTAFAEQEFESLGYTLTKAGDIPGFYTDIDMGRPGPTIALLGELDSVICAAHPAADPETGAVHACGHAAQMAGLIGVAAVLKEPGVLDGLSGRIRLMAVPAEELLEIGFRDTLRDQGTIHYYGGKVEFLHRGYFDDVDIAILVHSANLAEAGPDCRYAVVPGGNGCLLKNMIYKGKAAHAGGSPEKGINALYAANLGMQAVNALRETFVEKDYIRFHPIITEGGQMVNAIPDTVRVESYVRGASWEAILEANERINRALAAGALAMGGQMQYGDRPGYSPLHNDPNLIRVSTEAMRQLYGDEAVLIVDEWDTGSTDMGDLSTVMPVLQICAAGATGHGHGADYYIEDRDKACLGATVCLAATAISLLQDNAAKANKVIAKAKPVFPNKEAYFALMDSLFLDDLAIEYNETGAQVQWKRVQS